MLKQKLPLLQQ